MSQICFSRVQVSNITPHGFWIEVDDEEEVFLSFLEYPGFEHATIAQLCRVQWGGTSAQLYWPDLNRDISLTALRSQDHLPLSWTAYN